MAEKPNNEHSASIDCYAVLNAVRMCAETWEGDACLLGNVRAGDLAAAIAALPPKDEHTALAFGSPSGAVNVANRLIDIALQFQRSAQRWCDTERDEPGSSLAHERGITCVSDAENAVRLLLRCRETTEA